MNAERKTKRGTPIDPKWDDAWVAKVESVEAELGRRTCGARLSSWFPCVLTADYPNGRCRLHGGTKEPFGAMSDKKYYRYLRERGDPRPLSPPCPMNGIGPIQRVLKQRPHRYDKEEYRLLASFLEFVNLVEEEPELPPHLRTPPLRIEDFERISLVKKETLPQRRNLRKEIGDRGGL